MCGFGGTFAVKMAPISAAIVDEKVDHVLEKGVELPVGLDMSCLMNIGRRLRRRMSATRSARALTALGDALPTCVTLVTGPSASADIVGLHTLGVHGPGEVHVWLIDNE